MSNRHVTLEEDLRAWWTGAYGYDLPEFERTITAVLNMFRAEQAVSDARAQVGSAEYEVRRTREEFQGVSNYQKESSDE